MPQNVLLGPLLTQEAEELEEEAHRGKAAARARRQTRVRQADGLQEAD